MTELKNGVTFDIPVGRREAETPVEIFHEDVKIKKSCVPHYTPKTTVPHPTNKQFKDRCGDTYKISLGYPMTFVEYRQLPSDDLKQIYIESMLEKYPGMSPGIFSKMLGVDPATGKKEFNRFGLTINVLDRSTARRYNKEIASILKKIEDGELPRNLTITKNRKIKKLRRKSYQEVCDMDPEEAKQYIVDIYDKYDRALTISDFGELLGCHLHTAHALINKYGVHTNKGMSVSPSVAAAREKFRSEMLAPPAKRDRPKKVKEEVVEQKIEETLIVEKSPESIPADNDTSPEFDINVIECILDSENIAKFLETYGFSGRIKIRVEKI